MTRSFARAAALLSIAVAGACATPVAAPTRDVTRARTASGPAQDERAQGRYGVEPAVGPSAFVTSILEALRARSAVGSPLQSSAGLSFAARILARHLAAGDAAPLAPDRIRNALTLALAFDPAPRAFAVDAPAGAAAGSILASVVPQHGDSHAGVGVVATRDRVHVVVLLSSRLATLEAFPRETVPDQRFTLRGRLPSLARPSVHVTAPSGESRTVSIRRDGSRFEAPLLFDAAGRWTVEVVGEGVHGPQVAALLTVSCGGAPLVSPLQHDAPDPDDPREAEARVIAAIGRTRGGHGLARLQESPALSEVARRHAEAMLRAGILAHRLDGEGAAERLRRARVPFAIVLENVAKGPSAITAHRLAEESPAHRQNILSPDVTRVGVGIARGVLAGGEPIVYLTELFTSVAGDPDDDPLTLEARVREAIWRERARAGASPLRSDPALDELARTAVREMIRRGGPDPGDLPRRALSLGRAAAAADAFVAPSPADAARSRNVTDRRFNRVGVSVGFGDGGRPGAGLLWIAVIYTD